MPPVIARILAHPLNARLVAALRATAVERPGDPRWSPGGWELHTHPDLSERLCASAGRGAASEHVVLLGASVLADERGLVFALAQGTSGLALRLGDASCELAAGCSPRSDLGEGWYGVDPWAADVPGARHLADLARACAAREH